MLAKTMFLKKFHYNYLTNTRLLELAARLTPDQWTATHDYGHASLHETMFHVLVAEELWFYFCEHEQSPFGNPGLETFNYTSRHDYPDVAAIRAYADKNYGVFCSYLESLDDNKLAAMVTGRMPDPDGQVRSHPVWYILTHVLYHSAQHRSEVAALLTRYGLSPHEIDFLGHDW